MIRRMFLFGLISLLVLLVVADRVAVAAADRVVAAKLQTQEDLSSKPSVSIGGFPFLTQALGGRYDDVTVTVHDIERSTVRIDTIKVRLRGVHVPLHAVFSQKLGAVAVDRGTAELTLAYADLNAFLRPKGITVAGSADGSVTATGTLVIAGQRVSASGAARLAVTGTDLRLSIGPVAYVDVPLGHLPFAIELTSARGTNRGIVVTGGATGFVVRPKH